MIASTMDPAWQLVVVAVSLATSYAIVFVAGFSRQDRRHSQQGIFQRPGVETIVTYLAALVVAALLLWVFQRGVHPPADLLSRSEEHTSELQSLMRISYAVFCLKNKKISTSK